MKPIALTAAAFLALAAGAVAAPALAESDVEIKNAVARVVVIVEDRTDIAVEIEPGSSGLPALQVTRRGDRVIIDGDLRRRIRNCSGVNADAVQPGDGASVEVRDLGRVPLNDAPLIVIRSPRAVELGASGAVFGAVGRGASSVDLSNGGCGAWTIANVGGPLSVGVGGSGPVRAGTSQSLELAIGGSGDIIAGATGPAEVSIGGSGRVELASASGDIEIAIGGSGDVRVRGGRSQDIEVSIAGSGDIQHGGEVRNARVSIVGAGDVRLRAATGTVSRSIMGSGDVTVGR